MSDLDAIVIGAGHNGLTCAAYLGMAGLRVRVLERRGVVGGACVTEEFYPGFRNSTAAYTVGLLQPKIIRDLKLGENGLRIVERRAQNFLPLPDGQYLLTGEGRTETEIAKLSAKDAARYSAYQAEISRRFAVPPIPLVLQGARAGQGWVIGHSHEVAKTRFRQQESERLKGSGSWEPSKETASE